MLNKRTVIGAFILLAIVGGTLWYLRVQRIMNAEPTRVYKVPETQKAAETTGGHWHGDEWHAEPHPETPKDSDPFEAAPRALPRLAPLEEVNEELRAILAVPLPPDADELLREHYALGEETLWLNENGHTLSRAERHKARNALGERLLDWNKRFSKRSRERLEAIRQEAEAKRARRARGNRGDK